MRLASLVFALFLITLHAAPVPAPILQSPADGASAVPVASTLSWTWRDSLLVNGAFEQGLTAGWQSGGASVWTLSRNSDIQSGTNIAEAFSPFQSPTPSAGTGSLIQQVTLPADAVTATLNWYESLQHVPIPRSTPWPRLEVSLWLDSQTKLETLHVSYGIETEWSRFKWVRRTNDLSAYVGQTVRLVVEASKASTLETINPWVDGFSLLVERTDLPWFEIYLGTAVPLGPVNLIGRTNALSLNVAGLPPNTLHYWQVASVRDGVTNRSPVRSFTTEQAVLSTIDIVSRTTNRVTVGFNTRINRFYAIEQSDNLETVTWNEVFPSTPGTGNPMMADLPINSVNRGFWRLRVDP